MNCDWFEARLDELLDERLPPGSDAELIEHAETCRRCDRLLTGHQALLEAIEVLVRSEPQRGLAERILAEAGGKSVSMARGSIPAAAERRSIPERQSMRQLATWITATVAAAVLIAVGVTHWNVNRSTAPVAEPNAISPDTRKIATVTPPDPVAVGLHDSLAAAPVTRVGMLANLITPQQRILMEQMTDGLKPVTHSMSAAFNALRHTLPGSEMPARS